MEPAQKPMNTKGFDYRVVLRKALKIGAVETGIVVIWIVLVWSSVLPVHISDAGNIILGALLFLLALPLSMVLRLDRIQDVVVVDTLPLLLIAALMVALNWTILILVTGYLRYLGVLKAKIKPDKR